VLDTYLDVFTHHYLQAKHQLPVDMADALHQRLRDVCGLGGSTPPHAQNTAHESTPQTPVPR
jgi:hypothetical protein